MKIRAGFVSNSSSSSFVLAIRELPKTFEEFFKLWFTNEHLPDFYSSSLGWGGPKSPEEMKYYRMYSPETVLRNIWDDIHDKTSIDKKIADSQVIAGDPDDVEDLDYSDYTDEDGERDWAAIEAAEEISSTPITQDMLDSLTGNGWQIYRLEYADESGGMGCILEHNVMHRNNDDHIVIEGFSHH